EINAPGKTTLRAGELQLAGTLAHYTFDLKGTGFAPAVGTVIAHLNGTGGLEAVTLDSSTAKVLGGNAAATGTVGWWPKVEWNLVILGDSLGPAPFFPNPPRWHGSHVSFRLVTSGEIDSSGFAGKAALDSLGGKVRGQPVSGQAEIAFAPQAYDVSNLELHWGTARLLAHGIVRDTIAASYDLAIADLRTALRRPRGSVQLVGTASGPRDAPRLAARVEARNLVSGANRLRHLTGSGSIELASRGRNDVELRGEDAGLGRTRFDSLRVSLHGT